MFILLPIISFLLFWFIFYQQKSQGIHAFLYAAALWGSIVWFLTEVLSFFHALSLGPLILGWSLILLGAAYWASSYKRALRYNWLIHLFKNITFTEKLIIFLIISISVLKGISAIYSAPNTYDAMTYHLNRVEHWIQNGTVAHYPTHVIRQLYSPPWAEYAVLQLRILSNGDYFSNAVQWFAAMGAWVSVAGLSALLGAKRKGQLIAVLLAACLPTGLVQQTSTQTDYVMTFWLTGFVYLLWMTYQKPSWKLASAAGSYLGLAFLTKGTAYLLAPVWIVIFLIAVVLTRDLQKLKSLALILIIACIINLPFAIRNTNTFGSPYWTHVAMTNQRISFGIAISNITYNLALHAPIPQIADNHLILQEQSRGEDDTGNEAYLCLMIGVLLWLILYQPLRHKIYLIYGICIVLMFIVFSEIIHKNPFNSRFHLAIFIISTPLVGAVLTEWLAHRWVWIAAMLIYVNSWAWLFKCNEHPLVGDRSIFITTRPQQYFSTRPMLIYPYTQTAKLIATSTCRDIGLINDEDDMGYPWWILLRQNLGNKFRMEDVEIKNRSASLAYPKGPFNPCALIVLNDTRTMISLSNSVYVRVWFMQLPDSMTSVFERAL